MAPGKFTTGLVQWILRYALLCTAIWLTNDRVRLFTWVPLIAPVVLDMKACTSERSVCKHAGIHAGHKSLP